MHTVLSLETRISGDSIAYRIKEMDESLRITDKIHEDIFYCEQTGMSIRGYEFPEIRDTTIYLRGSNRERDMSYFVVYPFMKSVDNLHGDITITLYKYISHVFNEPIHTYFNGHTISWLLSTMPQSYTLE